SPICWPFLENCYRWRVLSADVTRGALVGLALLSIGNAALFIRRRHAMAAVAGLVLLTAVKNAAVLQDYRLVLNQHYMSLWVFVAFILVSSPQRALAYLLVSFYFWAGLL